MFLFSTLTLFISYSQVDTSKKLKPLFRLDNRTTHINGQFSSIYGGFTGLNINNKLRLKIGFSLLPFQRGNQIINNQIKMSTLYFFTLGEEYDFYRKNKFGFTSYIQLGYGKHNVFYNNLNLDLIEKQKNNILIIETGLLAFYDVNTWLTLKLGGGWRFELIDKENNLNGYFIKLAAGINLKKLYTTIFHEKN